MFIEASALNVDYRLPKAWDKRIYDFYAFAYLASVVGNTLDQAEREHFKETERHILDTLMKDFKREILLSCVGELRHIMFHVNVRAYKALERSVFFLEELSEYRNRESIRRDIDVILKSHNLSESDAINVFIKSFSAKWMNKDYGGDSWKTIAQAWHDLSDAKLNKDKYVLIDHIFDLQHNGGSSFLDKGITPRDARNVKDALDMKREVSSMETMRPYLSRSMRIIVNSYTPSHIQHTARKPVRALDDLLNNPKKYLKHIKYGKVPPEYLQIDYNHFYTEFPIHFYVEMPYSLTNINYYRVVNGLSTNFISKLLSVVDPEDNKYEVFIRASLHANNDWLPNSLSHHIPKKILDASNDPNELANDWLKRKLKDIGGYGIILLKPYMVAVELLQKLDNAYDDFLSNSSFK